MPAWAAKYLPQRLQERCRREPDGPTLPPSGPSDVGGQVWRMSRDAEGSRAVQQALHEARTDEERMLLAEELRGHVWEATKCPHANHVLQKCIISMRPQALQFIIDEFCEDGKGGPVAVANHKFGCRVLERLIEHCPQSQVAKLVDLLAPSAVSLASNPYGNYVMQHLIEHGPSDHRHKFILLLQENAAKLGVDAYARAVLSKALAHANADDQIALARALLRQKGLIATMARTRHGHPAVKSMLNVLTGTDAAEARRQLLQEIETLRKSRYGRFAAVLLDAEFLR